MADDVVQTIEPWNKFLLGGGVVQRRPQFPPSLNNSDAASDLENDETPDGYGFALTKDGRLVKGTTIPTATARVAKTVTIGGIPYFWYYNRLWNITNLTASTASNILRFGAPGYDSVYVPQRSGKIACNDDATTLLGVIPFGQDSMLVVKTTGSYVLSNLLDTRAFNPKGPFLQELAVAAMNQVTELDGIIYMSNASGLFSFDGAETKELTRSVRGTIAPFINQVLTVDYNKKRIKGGSNFIYEVPTGKIFRYNSTAFRYTTRQFHLSDWAPFAFDRIIFTIEHGAEADHWLNFQFKAEDEAWSDDVEVTIAYEAEQYTDIPVELEMLGSVHKYQVRITDMSSNLYVKQIRGEARQGNYDGYGA